MISLNPWLNILMQLNQKDLPLPLCFRFETSNCIKDHNIMTDIFFLSGCLRLKVAVRTASIFQLGPVKEHLGNYLFKLLMSQGWKSHNQKRKTKKCSRGPCCWEKLYGKEIAIKNLPVITGCSQIDKELPQCAPMLSLVSNAIEGFHSGLGLPFGILRFRNTLVIMLFYQELIGQTLSPSSLHNWLSFHNLHRQFLSSCSDQL